MLHFGGHGQARPPVLSSAIQLDNRKGPETEAARAAPRTVAVREILQVVGPGPGCRRRPVGWWSWPRA